MELGSTGSRRGKEGPFPTGFRGNAALPTPSFHIASLQSSERINSSPMSHPGCGPLFRQPEQINLTVDEVRAPGLIHTPDRVCSPHGKPGVDGSHQGTECQATVPGRMGRVPLTPAVPFLVLSHPGRCCCCGHQLRAAVEPLDTNAAGQPDMGPAVSCTPSPIAEHGMPTETLLETQLHTPKGWALTPRGRPGLLGWEGRSPSPAGWQP